MSGKQHVLRGSRAVFEIVFRVRVTKHRDARGRLREKLAVVADLGEAVERGALGANDEVPGLQVPRSRGEAASINNLFERLARHGAGRERAHTATSA